MPISKPDSIPELTTSPMLPQVEECMGHIKNLSKILPNSKVDVSAKMLGTTAAAFEKGKLPKALCAALIRYEAWAKDMSAVEQWLSGTQCDRGTAAKYAR